MSLVLMDDKSSKKKALVWRSMCRHHLKRGVDELCRCMRMYKLDSTSSLSAPLPLFSDAQGERPRHICSLSGVRSSGLDKISESLFESDRSSLLATLDRSCAEG